MLFYVIDFYPIGIYTCLALQNYHQNINFVNDICLVGKKMARNGCKMAKRENCHFFQTEFIETFDLLEGTTNQGVLLLLSGVTRDQL